MIAIAYVSTAVHAPSRIELEDLLLDARAFNAEAGVSGALLVNDRAFFQYFEGEAASVEEVYGRIKRSRLHRGIVELLNAPVERRHFEGWTMGFARAPRGTLLELANARWMAQAGRLSPEEDAPGVVLLMDFWRRAEQRA